MRTSRRTAATTAATTLAVASLVWAPTAFAEAPELPPGTVEITKKDPDGTPLAGAAFALLDTLNGTKASQGKTSADGHLRFEGVYPGSYRLKETSTGSAIHELAPDRDVIVTPGQTVKLTVIDAFKPAVLLVKKTDKKTGKPLAGAVINVTPVAGSGKAIKLTTGKDGTISTRLPVFSGVGTAYTAAEIKAPAGYQLDSTLVKINAKPAATFTAAFTNTVKPKPTQPPVTPSPTLPVTPTVPPTAPQDTPTTAPTPSRSASTTPAPLPTEGIPSTPAPKESLAHTGADSTAWLLAGAGALIATGGAALIALRRRKTADDGQPTT